MRATEFLVENADQAAVDALLKKHGWSIGRTSNGDLAITWQGSTYVFYGERVRITSPDGKSVSVVWGKKPDWHGRPGDISFAQAVQQKYLTFDLPIWQALDRGQINDTQAIQKFKIENERQAREAIAQGVTEGREKFNDEVMQPGFRWSEDINGITYLVRTRWDNMPEVVARVNNREVGRATFINHHTRSGLESVSTYVSPKWQGWGIAKNMYAVMRMLGANIQPSATQTAMGKDMWAKWKKGGDTKHLTSMNAKMDEQGVTEFAPAANDDNDKKAYLLQLAQALGDAMYGTNKNKQAVLDIKSKIVDAGGDVKILWNDDGTFNVVMYHPTYFKQGYLIKLVGGQGPALSENNKVKPIAQPKQHTHVPPEKKTTPAAIIHLKQTAITEGLSHPVICVDVQPEYNGGPWPPANPKFVQIMNFVQKQTGPVLFFINAEDQGMSGDSIQQIQQFWDETLGTEGEEGEDDNGEYYYNEPESPIDWRRFEIVDKGYGYLRSWMDHGIEPSIIIATIREMYAQKVSDTRDLEFPAFNRRTTTQSLIQGAIEEMQDDPMTVGWASVAQLKRFNGAYLVGGGRDECLREVELLMNAFNIKYKRIDSLVY